jgi:hypothetical protein
MGKIANPQLAQVIADGIVKPASQLKAKRKPKQPKEDPNAKSWQVTPVAPVNEVAALPGGESLNRVEKKTLEHIQHHYDKDAKIQRQSCMKAAASVYNPPFGEDVDVIASKVIQIAEKLYQWVNSN